MLDSVSSPITRRVYLGLDEFIAWYTLERRPGFTKAAVAAWRVALEARRLGSVSINVRITAVPKLAAEASDKTGSWGTGIGRRCGHLGVTSRQARYSPSAFRSWVVQSAGLRWTCGPRKRSTCQPSV